MKLFIEDKRKIIEYKEKQKNMYYWMLQRVIRHI